MDGAFDGVECALQPAKELILSIQVPTKQERFKVQPLGPPSPDLTTVETDSGADDRA